MKRSSLVLLGVAAALASSPAASSTSGAVSPDRLSATLDAESEVPAPRNVPTAAAGHFTATLSGRELKFTLTFAHLSSRAIAAHVQLGAVGKAGAMLIPLCGPCPASTTAIANPTQAQITALKTGKAYVSIKTAKNPSGEVRGQIALTG